MQTTITDRGQTPIPASVRRKLKLRTGRKLTWELVSANECRIVVVHTPTVPAGAVAMLGYGKRFGRTRRTDDYLREMREGDRD